jgi:hypothetical protein
MTVQFSMEFKCQTCRGDGLIQESHVAREHEVKPGLSKCQDCAGTGLRDGVIALLSGATIPQSYGTRLQTTPS